MNGWELSRARLSFWLIGAALGAVVAFVLYRFIGTFVFGLFIYYATRPVYRRVKKRARMPASVTVAGSLFLLVLPALLLVGYATAIGIQELGKFINNGNLGPFDSLLAPYIDVSTIFKDPEQLLSNGGVEVVEQFLAQASSFAAFFGLMALHVFLMFAIAFYLLRDDHKLSRWFRTRFADEGGVVDEYVRAVDNDLHSIFFGNILNAVITGTIGAISYSFLNFVAPPGLAVPSAALLGLLAGIASLIPVVGMKLVYFPVGAYLLARPFIDGTPDLLWFPITFILVSLVIVDTIPDLVLRPYVSGRNLHVGMVMMAYVLGPLLFGWYGLFLAPLLLVFVVHFARIVLPELVSGRPIQPYAVDPSYLTGEPVTASVDANDATATESPTATPETTPHEEDHDSDVTSDRKPTVSEDRTPDDGASPT